jgi:hypothetical protein
VICEAAAVNHRQKKMGYNAAEELYRRVMENMSNGQGKSQGKNNSQLFDIALNAENTAEES